MVPWWQLHSVLLHRIPSEARASVEQRTKREGGGDEQRIKKHRPVRLHCVVWTAPVMRERLREMNQELQQRSRWVRQATLFINVALPQSAAREEVER